MAAVAGAVADHVLAAMGDVRRGFVNNGGDVAVGLAAGERLRLAAPWGRFEVGAEVGGVATSGAACKGGGGRSFSFGIADAVTVLARNAAAADAAASVIGNAVDLPGHPAVMRVLAETVDPDSDLAGRMVTWEVGHLSSRDVLAALDAGRVVADGLLRQGLILGAVLALRGEVVMCGQATERLEAA
jgi:ApbE superfamily uncharacterized protein (UPF0280 family)